VYEQSPEEEELVKQLISRARDNHNSLNQYLAIIACHMPIYQLSLNKDWLENYPTATYESRVLIEIQLQEPQDEAKIKSTIQGDSEVIDTVSVKVQDMYEERPYPRYRYADYADKSLAKSISKVIKVQLPKASSKHRGFAIKGPGSHALHPPFGLIVEPDSYNKLKPIVNPFAASSPIIQLGVGFTPLFIITL